MRMRKIEINDSTLEFSLKRRGIGEEDRNLLRFECCAIHEKNGKWNTTQSSSF